MHLTYVKYCTKHLCFLVLAYIVCHLKCKHLKFLGYKLFFIRLYPCFAGNKIQLSERFRSFPENW